MQKVFAFYLDTLRFSRGTSSAPVLKRPSPPVRDFMAFFNGASQQGGSSSRAGAIIYIDQIQFFKVWMNGGVGSNMRAELLALWMTLFFAKKKDILLRFLFGDS